MKKVFVVACLSVFVLASCKKDYTCECSGGTVSGSSTFKDVKKKDAEKACDELSVIATIGGGSCKIK